MGTGLGHFLPYVSYGGFWLMCVLALSGRARLAFYFVIPFIPYRTMRDKIGDFPLGTNLLTILLVAIVLGALISGKRLPPSRIYKTWLFFAIYLYISLWLGVWISNVPPPLWLSDANFVAWKDLMVLPLLLLASSLVLEERRHIRTTILLIGIAVALVTRSALLESLSHSWSVFDDNKRTAGPIEYGPNQLAAFLTQFGMFFWALATSLKRFKVKVPLYVLTFFTLLTMMYAFSRAAYIATLVGVLVLGLLKDRKLLIVLVAFMAVWQSLVPAAVTERVNMTHDANGQLDASAQERVDLWEQSKSIFLSSPVVGAGFGSFQFGHHTDSLKDTHNYYVKVLTETGLVGFAFFLILLWQMLAAGFRLFRRAADPLYKSVGLGFVVAVVCCIVSNGFGDRWTYVEINGLLWVLTGTVMCALKLQSVAQPVPEPAVIPAIADTHLPLATLPSVAHPHARPHGLPGPNWTRGAR